MYALKSAGMWRHGTRSALRRKHSQGTRTETVKLHGARDGRGQELCNLLCSVLFCPCNMPAVAARRHRVTMMQATSFMKWVRWRPDWEHIGTPQRIKWAAAFSERRIIGYIARKIMI